MSHPDRLPDLFLDRSLGRIQVPRILRAAGPRLAPLPSTTASRPTRKSRTPSGWRWPAVTDYRDAIPALFVHNRFVICSNGSEARVGSTYASWEFFGDWKVIDADGTRCIVALETAIRGTCAHDRLLDLVENFVAYIERPGGLVKVVARNHQFLGVNAAIENLHRVGSAGEKRLGVFWHTQGSGKSLSMLWFTQKVLSRIPGAWTFVMAPRRLELDATILDEESFTSHTPRHPWTPQPQTGLLSACARPTADRRMVAANAHPIRTQTVSASTSTRQRPRVRPSSAIEQLAPLKRMEKRRVIPS